MVETFPWLFLLGSRIPRGCGIGPDEGSWPATGIANTGVQQVGQGRSSSIQKRVMEIEMVVVQFPFCHPEPFFPLKLNHLMWVLCLGAQQSTGKGLVLAPIGCIIMEDSGLCIY